MEISTKAYQIARKLHRQTNTLDHSHLKLPQFENSVQKSITFKQTKIHNIFKDNEEIRIRKLEIQKDRQYEITGAGAVLKINKIKNKKKRDAKNTTSQEKNTVITNKTSRQSFSPYLSSIYLTKDEVLGLHSHQTSSIGTRSLQETSEILFPMKRFNMTETQKHNDSYTFTPNQTLGRNLSKKFSVAKLKQRLLEYKTSWNKLIIRKKQLKSTKGQLRKKRIADLVEKQREDKKLVRTFEAPTFSWVFNLRQEQDKQNKQERTVQVIEHNGLAVSGRSKLNKQTLWVQQKHNKGFFFCRHQNLKDLQLFYKQKAS